MNLHLSGVNLYLKVTDWNVIQCQLSNRHLLTTHFNVIPFNGFKLPTSRLLDLFL